MNIRFSVFIASSVDGYIARKDGSLDWLPGSDGRPLDEDTGYDEFYASVDTLVMGRNTYEFVQSFGEWPYQGKRVVVLSHRYARQMQQVTEGVWGTSASPQELAAQLAELGARHVYVDGGKTIQGFLRAELISEMTITRIPVLLGEGIPLFGALEQTRAGAPIDPDIQQRHGAEQIRGDTIMATDRGTVDFLLDQLAALGEASVRKMFGEYCLYLSGKPVGLVCDDQLYLKPTQAGRAMLHEVVEGSPYPCAKPHLLITPDQWEDAEWLCGIVRATARELPQPKLKRSKPKP